jgi:hypothetical protein
MLTTRSALLLLLLLVALFSGGLAYGFWLGSAKPPAPALEKSYVISHVVPEVPTSTPTGRPFTITDLAA